MSQQTLPCTPPKRSRVGSFFSHRCLVPLLNFPQRKNGFFMRYSVLRHNTQTQFQQSSFDNNE